MGRYNAIGRDNAIEMYHHIGSHIEKETMAEI